MPARRSRVLDRTGHRPWPLPRRPWVGWMVWEDLLFAHWPVPPEALEPHVPPGLPLDLHGGKAWVSVAAFTMQVGLRGGLRLPGHTRFPELNVRTYTTVGGRPGVFFFSLDAASGPVAALARRWFRLPYHHARMEHRTGGPGGAPSRFASRRRDGSASFAADYRGTGPPRAPGPGTLDHFLTERYALFTVHRGRVLRGDIHHAPWPLEGAEGGVDASGVAPWAPGLLAGPPERLHRAGRLEVLMWGLEEERGRQGRAGVQGGTGRKGDITDL